MGDFSKTKEYRALKKSLMDNLEARGLTDPIYADMVRRYLRLCVDEREADRELEEKGMNIWDERRESWQVNPCVSAKMNICRQAAAIYRSLGFEDTARRAVCAVADDDL